MNDGYPLSRTAFHRYIVDDEKVPLKILRLLDAADSADSSLVEGFIRLKHDRRFKDPQAILAAFRKAGDLGFGYGHFYAGLCYANGYGTRRNRKTANQRYRAAADDGCINAMFALGTVYRMGDGVAPDVALALDYYERAAGQHLPCTGPDRHENCDTIRDYVHISEKEVQLLAMEQLGKLHWDPSYGVPQDIDNARFWLGRAGQRGSAYAKSILRKLPPPFAAESTPGNSTIPSKLTPGPTEVNILVNGLSSAEAYLQGKMHRGAPRPEFKRAARYFEVAAQLGHKDAKATLAEIKAVVGNSAFSLFFPGWNATLPP